MHHDLEKVLITQDQLEARVRELGQAITAEAPGEPIMLIGILKGSVFFLADLARAIEHPVTFDFIAVSSYGMNASSTGTVRVLKDLDSDIQNKHVILVEDIIDSGLTLSYVVDMLKRRQPASLMICSLLNKADRREVDIHVDLIGFNIPDAFVVGYGLDYAENYRNLPYIGILKPTIYTG